VFLPGGVNVARPSRIFSPSSTMVGRSFGVGCCPCSDSGTLLPQHVRSLCVSAACGFVVQLVAGPGVQAREALLLHRSIPDSGTPSFGGRSFDDSPAAINPWDIERPMPGVGDLFPEVPLSGGMEEAAPARRPDTLSPYDSPRTFPSEQSPEEAAATDSSAPVKRFEDRRIISVGDKLNSYPATARGDRVAGGAPPTSPQDEVSQTVARYLHQHWDRQLHAWCTAADSDGDAKISSQEMQQTLSSLVGMSAESAQDLLTEIGLASSDDQNQTDDAQLITMSECLMVLQAACNSFQTSVASSA